MKIILAGTPEFSIKTFETIINNFDVIAIISQPDRKIGRKQILTSPPVAQLAMKYQIPIYQPQKILELLPVLEKLDFDLFITMAYGQIIPEAILNLAKKLPLNLHASLLPQYRGAAPVQRAIWDGQTKTGMTLMKMAKTLDSGQIIFQASIDINEFDTSDDLLNKLADLSSKHIVKWLNEIKNNQHQMIDQDLSKVTYAAKILPADEKIELDTIEKTMRKINALSSNPGAYWIDPIRNKRIKIYRASKSFVANAIELNCTDGKLYATSFQIEGKNKVTLR